MSISSSGSKIIFELTTFRQKHIFSFRFVAFVCEIICWRIILPILNAKIYKNNSSECAISYGQIFNIFLTLDICWLNCNNGRNKVMHNSPQIRYANRAVGACEIPIQIVNSKVTSILFGIQSSACLKFTIKYYVNFSMLLVMSLIWVNILWFADESNFMGELMLSDLSLCFKESEIKKILRIINVENRKNYEMVAKCRIRAITGNFAWVV